MYAVPGSHPSWAARLMLERKRIEHRRVDLVAVLHRPLVRALRFPAATVPALSIDGRRVQGSREIARALEELRPEPPLFPREPARRAAVEDAERWGDQVLQSPARRIVWNAIARDRSSIGSFLEGARLGVPAGLAARTAAPVVWAAVRLNDADDATVEADLTALPAMLDEVDTLIERGVLAGEEPNAADFQIATSVRLLMCLDDLRPPIEARPAGRLANRVVPDFPGRIRPVLPPAWLEPLRGSGSP